MKPIIQEDAQDLVSLESYAPILDVHVDIYAELDRRIVSFGELVSLDVDSLLPLCRPSGENIDLYVEGVLLGNGEILVVESKLAIRVADLRDKPSTLPQSVSAGEAE